MNLFCRISRVFRISKQAFHNAKILSEDAISDNSKSVISTNERSNENPKELLENSASYEEVQPASPEDAWATSPYPTIKNKRKFQGCHFHVPEGSIDPETASILLFPGQGVQYIGMGKEVLDYPNVKEMYEYASEILGYNLLDICLNGPKEKLDRTEYCQPAVVVSSLAAVERLKDEKPQAIDSCMAVAGFSVGEITALIFSGAISFEKGLELVKIRAESMQACSEMISGGMMTVFYGADHKLKFACKVAQEWCKKQGVINPECKIANYLYPGCKVIAGNREALDFITKHSKEFNLRRLKSLPVSGAFHTYLMRAAADPIKEFLKTIEINDPLVSVYSNVNGKRYKDKDHIMKQLPTQVYQSLKWEQTMHVMFERPEGTKFPFVYECGPGSSLTSILKQVNFKAAENCSTFKI